MSLTTDTRRVVVTPVIEALQGADAADPPQGPQRRSGARRDPRCRGRVGLAGSVTTHDDARRPG
jgi:hypothetical protein